MFKVLALMILGIGVGYLFRKKQYTNIINFCLRML
jgi:uncharacterized membrane protein